jgi:photosystem II stability/assembly factor-like uncharacterized protein
MFLKNRLNQFSNLVQTTFFFMKYFHILFIFTLLLFSCQKHPRIAQKEAKSPSHAGESMRMWAMARTFPDGKFHTENYQIAYDFAQQQAQARGGNNVWESLGPKNVGGRTLCLAFHPTDQNVMFAGTASGGLWKTTTAGEGYTAWQYIETGFPVLGISAIAINPENPNEMYLGTGEVYNVENSMPNVAIRVTRGSYGIGILKSMDGGVTWSKSLDWAYGDLKGVQDLKINPLNSNTIFAATTEGLYRSYNAGASWQIVHNKRMAVDIELHPTDTTRLFVTHGSLDDEDVSGIYRSTNAGNSFSKLTTGLPSDYSGKTMLSICKSEPNTIYASVANNVIQDGLYKSINGGNTWTLKSTQNVATYQGWYSHDISANNENPNDVVWVGIEAFISTDGGAGWSKKSSWSAWTFGQVPVGGPEGPENYCHADIHRIYHHWSDPNKVYYATDGGVFVSFDGGNTFEGRNGSLQCTQFYANFSNSTSNGSLGLGGMQDNATAIYTGDDAWTRVIGADGECTGIDPTNDQIMYGSSQYLNMYRSDDGGINGFNSYIAPPDDGTVCFNGPFEVSFSEPATLYAGGTSLWKSTAYGENWQDVSGGTLENNGILNLAICPTDANLVYFSIAPTNTNNIGIFKTSDGGSTISQMEGLPNRMCMDIAFHPTDPNTVYAVFAGFGSAHVWKTNNGGTNWTAIDNGLPDLPTNTILVDPLAANHLYIGNDLGVWHSANAGISWEYFSSDAPKGLLVMHLSVSPANRKLRVATYGLGVWQTDMADITMVGTQNIKSADGISLKINPNPVVDMAEIMVDLTFKNDLTFKIFDAQGKMVSLGTNALNGRFEVGKTSRTIDLKGLKSGSYTLGLEGKGVLKSVLFVKI